MQAKIDNKTVRLFIPFYNDDRERDESSYGYRELQQIINELDTSNVVQLHNWLDIDEVHRYLSLGDVVINPGAFVESFGLVPLESVLAGTPAVCSRVGALRDLEGIPGLYHVDYGDIDGFVEKIIEAINVDQSTLDDGKNHVETLRYLWEGPEGWPKRQSRAQCHAAYIQAQHPAGESGDQQRGQADPRVHTLSPLEQSGQGGL